LSARTSSSGTTATSCSGGASRRARAGTLTFTGTTGRPSPAADFVVVSADAFFGWPSPGTPPRAGAIRADYRGMLENYYTHDADDALTSMPKAQVQV
jgi:hypothetical protein